ncbi:MAG: response regulator transcription factor [Lachnospiraceae bacterium]|nr:response regulator transcription factor [Lachnospiraceae bacterium]
MNRQDAVRVIVCDDQNISRGFFEMYVRAAAGFELIAGLRTAREAVDYLKEHEVDLLILDVMMQDGIDGLSAAALIKKEHPQLKIILTTSAAETGWEDKARAIGVESFWYKEYDEHGIQEIMNRTMAGESVYPGDAPDVSFGKIKRSDLTDRELDVLRELTGSLTNEEIAEKLCISVNTVKRHIQNIMEKTGYENRLDVAMNAKALGLVVSDKQRTGNG